MGRRHECNDCSARKQRTRISQPKHATRRRAPLQYQDYDADDASTFMNTDARVIAGLPEPLQDLFPAFLTGHASVSKDVLFDMRAGASERASFAPRRKLMVEKRAHALDVCQKNYYAVCLHLKQQGSKVDWPKFSSVSTALKNNFLYVPSATYLKDVYVKCHFAFHRPYQNLYQQNIFGRYWAVDHSFKLTKRITMNGVVLYLCLFTITNEFGQIVKQALCTSKGREELRSMLVELRERSCECGLCQKRTSRILFLFKSPP